MARYQIEAGDIVDYVNAESEEQALDLWAKNAGYADFAALQEVAPGTPQVRLADE